MAAMRRAQVLCSTTAYVLCYLVMFVLGMVTGLVLANADVDLPRHDTYYAGC